MHFQQNHVKVNVFYYDVIFLVFVFLRFLCKFSIKRELNFMLESQKNEKIKEKYIFGYRSHFKPNTDHEISLDYFSIQSLTLKFEIGPKIGLETDLLGQNSLYRWFFVHKTSHVCIQ